MLRSLHILLISLVSLSHPCCAITIKTNDVHKIESEVTQANPETLVIFDVDDVLMHADDQILKVQNKPYLEALEQKLEKKLGEEKADALYSLIFLQRKNGPVDKRIIQLIANLQEKGIKVLALTNCFTGKYGAIDSMEDWRINELEHIGYHFDKSWSDTKPHHFEGLSKQMGQGLSAKSSSVPLFKGGVVFTSSVSKGEALKAFLAYAGLSPRKIIFIDDKKKHIESVEKTVESLGIPFVGIEYTAVKDARAEPLNKERAEFQFEVLEKEHKWLSDQEAEVKLRKKE